MVYGLIVDKLCLVAYFWFLLKIWSVMYMSVFCLGHHEYCRYCEWGYRFSQECLEIIPTSLGFHFNILLVAKVENFLVLNHGTIWNLLHDCSNVLLRNLVKIHWCSSVHFKQFYSLHVQNTSSISESNLIHFGQGIDEGYCIERDRKNML